MRDGATVCVVAAGSRWLERVPGQGLQVAWVTRWEMLGVAGHVSRWLVCMYLVKACWRVVW